MDGEVYDVTEVPELSKSKQHNIDVVVDRIVIKEGIRSRLFDSIEAALRNRRRLCDYRYHGRL